jgi:hypothetical protein
VTTSSPSVARPKKTKCSNDNASRTPRSLSQHQEPRQATSFLLSILSPFFFPKISNSSRTDQVAFLVQRSREKQSSFLESSGANWETKTTKSHRSFEFLDQLTIFFQLVVAFLVAAFPASKKYLIIS